MISKLLYSACAVVCMGVGWSVGRHVNSKVPLYIYILFCVFRLYCLFLFVISLFYLCYVDYPLHKLLYTVMCKIWLTPP